MLFRSFSQSFAVRLNHYGSMTGRACPSTAGPLQDSVLAVAPAGDSALSRTARRSPRLKTLTKGELHDYITSIPLTKLLVADANVRKTAGADTALYEFAASIATHGCCNRLSCARARNAGSRKPARLLADARAYRND
jgi:hypothetical protein